MKRNYDNFHMIDNSPMLSPDVDVEITYNDDDYGAFDQAGYYHRMVGRFNRRTWKFKYAILTKEEFIFIRSLINEKESFIFSFLNERDAVETVRAYSKPVSVAYQSKRSGLYKNLTLEIVEC